MVMAMAMVMVVEDMDMEDMVWEEDMANITRSRDIMGMVLYVELSYIYYQIKHDVL